MKVELGESPAKVKTKIEIIASVKTNEIIT